MWSYTKKSQRTRPIAIPSRVGTCAKGGGLRSRAGPSLAKVAVLAVTGRGDDFVW